MFSVIVQISQKQVQLCTSHNGRVYVDTQHKGAHVFSNMKNTEHEMVKFFIGLCTDCTSVKLL